MAKQVGVIKLRGTLGDITFYKREGGFYAKMKTDMDGKKMATMPSFDPVLKQSKEFANGARTGKLLRMAFRGAQRHVADPTADRRLVSLLMQVLKTDPAPQGSRTVGGGNLSLLEHFEFNNKHIKGPLAPWLNVPFTTGIDRASGHMHVHVDAFTPATLFNAPPAATHYQFVLAGAAINFTAHNILPGYTESDKRPLHTTEAQPVHLQLSVAPGSALPLFLAFGVRFWCDGYSDDESLAKGAYNALRIVSVQPPTPSTDAQ